VDNERNNLIDLGLSALIKSLETAIQAPAAEEISIREVIETPQASTVLSPFAILADEGLWQKINELAERRMGTPGKEGIEATLWWIKASLSLGTMPAGILAAPLDSAARKALALEIGQRAELMPVAAQVAQEISTTLNGSADQTVRDSIDALLVDLGVKEKLQQLESLALPKWEDTSVIEQQKSSALKVKPRRFSFITSAALLTFLAACWFLFHKSTANNSYDLPMIKPEMLALAAAPAVDQQLLLPSLALKQNASQLDAVLYEMGPRQEVKEIRRESTAKERVDTSGPFEDEMPRREIQQAEQQQAALTDADKEQLFEAVADTEVHQAPNFRSEVAAVLHIGDVVAVDRELGDWVRLRSQRGKPGYVLSSDLRRSGRR
jgi:hypothetical protein